MQLTYSIKSFIYTTIYKIPIRYLLSRYDRSSHQPECVLGIIKCETGHLRYRSNTHTPPGTGEAECDKSIPEFIVTLFCSSCKTIICYIKKQNLLILFLTYSIKSLPDSSVSSITPQTHASRSFALCFLQTALPDSRAESDTDTQP